MLCNYTYNCRDCGVHDFALKMSEIPLLECPLCKCKEINRVWNVGSGNFNFHCDGAFSKPNIKE